jgi:hypothetical protein
LDLKEVKGEDDCRGRRGKMREKNMAEGFGGKFKE